MCGSFNLRWFTPTNEVNLCGHATLGTAAAIFRGCKNRSKKLVFHTASGELVVRRVEGTELGVEEGLEMDLPLNPPGEVREWTKRYSVFGDSAARV